MTPEASETEKTGAIRVLAAIGLAGLGFNFAVLLLAPLIRPDVDLLRDGLSHYAIGPWGGMQEAAFVALGFATAAIGLALILTGAPTRRSGWLLSLSSAGFLGLAAFPMGEAGP
ncbi:MAG: DUF998 domain-containing protein, partial [Thermomicrobiales bacterium]